MKALVETTIFANALLKASAERKAAQATLALYEETFGPVYAFKELKAGALMYFVWFHNKLVLNSFLDALRALHACSRTPMRYRTSTGMEALIAAFDEAEVPGEWIALYGPEAADASSIQKERLRLSLKRRIIEGWGKRRTLTTHVVCDLACYPETAVTETPNKTLEIEPIRCEVKGGCQLARIMAQDRPSVERLLAAVELAVKAAPQNTEHTKRAGALRKILKSEGWRSFSDQDCKAIGDAAFAFLAPPDVTILTTNLKDIEPLAVALGKTAHRP